MERMEKMAYVSVNDPLAAAIQQANGGTQVYIGGEGKGNLSKYWKGESYNDGQTRGVITHKSGWRGGGYLIVHPHDTEEARRATAELSREIRAIPSDYPGNVLQQEEEEDYKTPKETREFLELIHNKLPQGPEGYPSNYHGADKNGFLGYTLSNYIINGPQGYVRDLGMIENLIQTGEAYFQEHNRPFMKMSPTQWEEMKSLPDAIASWDAKEYNRGLWL
jgi:hypothetical protein